MTSTTGDICLTQLVVKNLKVESQRQIGINKFIKALAFSSIKFFSPLLPPTPSSGAEI